MSGKRQATGKKIFPIARQGLGFINLAKELTMGIHIEKGELPPSQPFKCGSCNSSATMRIFANDDFLKSYVDCCDSPECFKKAKAMAVEILKNQREAMD